MTDAERIAKQAGCDLRSVMRFLASAPIRPLVEARIAKAIKALKLTVTRAYVRAAS